MESHCTLQQHYCSHIKLLIFFLFSFGWISASFWNFLNASLNFNLNRKSLFEQANRSEVGVAGNIKDDVRDVLYKHRSLVNDLVDPIVILVTNNLYKTGFLLTAAHLKEGRKMSSEKIYPTKWQITYAAFQMHTTFIILLPTDTHNHLFCIQVKFKLVMVTDKNWKAEIKWSTYLNLRIRISKNFKLQFRFVTGSMYKFKARSMWFQSCIIISHE